MDTGGIPHVPAWSSIQLGWKVPTGSLAVFHIDDTASYTTEVIHCCPANRRTGSGEVMNYGPMTTWRTAGSEDFGQSPLSVQSLAGSFIAFEAGGHREHSDKSRDVEGQAVGAV